MAFVLLLIGVTLVLDDHLVRGVVCILIAAAMI